MDREDQKLILIADDDFGLRELMRDALELGGFAVAEAENGEQALDLFESQNPDLLLLDVLMPNMNGYEVCSKIRQQPKGRYFPIVMVTGLDDDDSINTGYECGATDFITKPITWGVLAHRVRYILRASDAERENAVARARMMDAIESFPASFFLYDSDDKLVTSNTAAKLAYPSAVAAMNPGTSRFEIVKATGESELINCIGDDVDAPVQKVLGDSPAGKVISEIRRNDNRWTQIIEQQTTDKGRVVLGIDITELKNREEQLEISKTKAESANRAKSNFIANMSHELRTPLNSIIGFSEILKNESFGPMGPPQYREYAGNILEGGRHLLHIINEILDMSKIEAGKLDLKETDFPVAHAVDLAIALVREQADNKNISLEIQSQKQPLKIKADLKLFKQMLLNLLSNAVKFTDQGGTIQVTANLNDTGEFVLSVSDTGMGIAPEDLEKVLMPFGQADDGLDRQNEGTMQM